MFHNSSNGMIMVQPLPLLPYAMAYGTCRRRGAAGRPASSSPAKNQKSLATCKFESSQSQSPIFHVDIQPTHQ